MCELFLIGLIIAVSAGVGQLLGGATGIGVGLLIVLFLVLVDHYVDAARTRWEALRAETIHIYGRAQLRREHIRRGIFWRALFWWVPRRIWYWRQSIWVRQFKRLEEYAMRREDDGDRSDGTFGV